MTSEILPFPSSKKTIWKRISSNLVLNTQTGVYYVRKEKTGKGRLFQTTGFKKKAAAQTKADQMVADWLYGKVKSNKIPYVSDICDEMHEVLHQHYLNKDRRERTWEHDRTYLPLLKKHFGTIRVDEFDEERWETWVRTQGKQLNRSLFDLSKYVSKLLTYSYSKKYILRKPIIKNPDKPKKSGVIYENTDVERFIKHSDPLLRDLIILAAESGMRPHENRELKWEWISIEEDRVTIFLPEDFTKTKNDRSFELSANGSKVIRNRFQKKKSIFVFPSPKNLKKPVSSVHLSRLWRRMIQNTNQALAHEGSTLRYPPGLIFHWLRHTFFTKALLDAKLPLAEVAQYGGNSPGILMKRYLQDDPSRTRSVAKAVNLNLELDNTPTTPAATPVRTILRKVKQADDTPTTLDQHSHEVKGDKPE